MAEPIIQVIFQDRILETVKIVKGITSVGRMSDNDVVINNLGVSRHHCRIIKEEDGSFSIEDLESANGIRVNNVQVKKSPLHNGDEIMIGKHKLVFQVAERGVAGFFKSEEELKADPRAEDRTIITAQAALPALPPELDIPSTPPSDLPNFSSPPPTPAPPQDDSAAPGTEAPPKSHFDHKLFEFVLKWSEYGIKVSFENKVISVHALKKPVLTVGRGPDNDIVIDNLGVSRLHAKIMQVDNQYIVEDQGSANGIRVNGVFVKRSPLYPGDEILLGKHLLTFDMSQRLLAGVQPQDIRRPAHSEHWQNETYALIPPILKEPEPAQSEQHPAEEPGKETAPWEGKYAVKVLLDGREVATYAITKRVTCIGRLKENDIVIDNLGVSRLHAKIMIEENGQIYIEDQESANGIVVNGLPLRRSPLYPSDEIIIVKHKLVFELAHKAKPQLKAAGGVMSTDPWSQDSTMMVSETDRERLKKQREERATKEKSEREAAAAKEVASKPAPPLKPSPPAAPSKPASHIPAPRAAKKEIPHISPKPGAPPHVGAVHEPSLRKAPQQQPKKAEFPPKQDRKFHEPTPPIRQAMRRIAKLIMSDGKELKITKDKFVIGKGDNVDLKVKGSWIKKQHVFIIREEIIFKLVSNGLIKHPKINGRSSSGAILKTGDVIELGDAKVTFQLAWEE